MVNYFENYGPFVPLVENHYQEINIKDITPDNYYNYFNGILNIMRDGIEDPEVQALKIGLTYADGNFCRFTLTDFFFQLIFYTLPIFIGEPVTPKYFIDTRAITKKTIENFINSIIKPHETDIDFKVLNNLIDDTIYKFKYIDEFSMYLANTVNFRDTLDLMEKYPEFNDTMHLDISGVPIEDVKSVGMEYTYKQIEYIKNNDHCLRDSFISGEAISPKQFKEVSVNIGTKPNGRGGIWEYVINNSFMNGGVSTYESYYMECNNGRYAQTLQKMNVGISGAFARLLETNNLGTFFNTNPNYACNTRNFIKVTIKDQTWLNIYDKRYYRFSPEYFALEYVLDKDKDQHLIGQTLYFRSPMTCASYARGEGLCRKCYGELFFVNKDVNPGKLAAELLSSRYTQMLLSAKHLLEASVVEMKWPAEFDDIFSINLNALYIDEDVDTAGMYMILDSNKFESDEEDMDEDSETSGYIYDEYTSSFDIMYPDGRIVNIHTANEDNIYLTDDLNRILKSKKAKEENGIYTIPLTVLKEEVKVIFTVKIQNNDLQKTLERSKNIIDKERKEAPYEKSEIIRDFITANLEGNINISSVHLETLLANQMRDPDDILEMPHWGLENAPYKILTLKSALNNSPSITTNLEFQRIGKTLVSPLSSKKKKPSPFDLFFMEKPQDFIVDKSMISDDYDMQEDTGKEGLKDAIYFVDSDNKQNPDS